MAIPTRPPGVDQHVPPVRLITIPFSHYCEKARWALDWAGVEFVEEAHLPFFHMPFVRRAGGARSTPVLVVGGRTLPDSTPIVLYADEAAPAGRKLVPAAGEERVEVLRLEERFDTALGPHTRRLAYAYALPDRALMVGLLRQHAPRWEAAVATASLPLVRLVLRKALRITPEGVQRSRARIREIFVEVEQLLGGRRYLVGDRFSAADLGFAARAAPVVTPPEYHSRLPTQEEMPPEMAADVRSFRDSVAGRFALRLFAEHRRTS